MSGSQGVRTSEDAQSANRTISTQKKRGKLTRERLTEILKYDHQSGIFRWAIVTRWRKRNKGVAGSFDARGYCRINIDGHMYLAHRLAFLYVYGHMPDNVIDHIDGNTKNNSISNLRDVSQQCNLRNSKLSSLNKSGVKGVIWNKEERKWRSFIRANGKQIYLGDFKNISDAIKARTDAENKHGYISGRI